MYQGTYSASISVQILGRRFLSVPRSIWTVVGVIIYTVCAIAGRNNLYSIFQNFLPLVGYWSAIWVVLVAGEEILFRRPKGGVRGGGYNWAGWNDKKSFPIGIAASIAFCIGYTGAVLSMDQVYFVGPIAKLVGSGADVSHSHLTNLSTG